MCICTTVVRVRTKPVTPIEDLVLSDRSGRPGSDPRTYISPLPGGRKPRRNVHERLVFSPGGHVERAALISAFVWLSTTRI